MPAPERKDDLVTCREEACGAYLRFLKNPKSGKLVPVDAETTSPEDEEYDPALGHVSHFKTCTAPSRFSSKRKG